MKNGNHAKGLNKKSIALVAAVSLMLVGVIGGTIAWLTDTSAEVKNTFTPTTLSVELDEDHEGPYTMVPGCDITKDPKVTYSTEVPAYVFVKVEASDNAAHFLTYSINTSEWTALGEAYSGVYYKAVGAGSNPDGISVLTGDKVTVSGGVTKGMMDDLSADTYPTLTFKAYIIQQANGDDIFSPEQAWAKLNSAT